MNPDKWTDGQLSALESKIRKVYGQALKDMGAILDEFVHGKPYTTKDGEQKKGKSLAEKEKAFEELVQKGIKTPDDLKQWRLNQMGREARFKAMQEKLAARATDAKQTAYAYINDATPGIYSLNRNYEAYTIEQVAGSADFALWDERTVKRLVVENPGLMPHYPKEKAVERGIDLEYGKQMITKYVTSGILRGGSVSSVASDLRQQITDMSYRSSVLAARTAVTGAQNAGRMDSYAAAEEMGIKMQRQWIATLDNRTRHAHAELDHQMRPMGEPFEVDGDTIEYPGDPNAPGYLVYNCRCTLRAVIDGHSYHGDRRAINPKTGESELISDMSYSEWAMMKETQQKQIDIT